MVYNVFELDAGPIVFGDSCSLNNDVPLRKSHVHCMPIKMNL